MSEIGATDGGTLAGDSLELGGAAPEHESVPEEEAVGGLWGGEEAIEVGDEDSAGGMTEGSLREAAGEASSEDLDEAVRPSQAEIEHARQVLAAGERSGELESGGSGQSADDLKDVQEDMQQTAEDAATLSNIASVRHQTAMGIIGNMR